MSNNPKKPKQTKLFEDNIPKEKPKQEADNIEIEYSHGKNVFELWLRNDKKVPFKVHRDTWHPSTYFIVKEVKDIKWDYYEKNGKIYGKAYGDIYVRGKLTDENIQLDGAGTYAWEQVE